MSRKTCLAGAAGWVAVVLLSGCGTRVQAALPDPATLAVPPAPARAIVPATPAPPAPASQADSAATPPAAAPPTAAARSSRDISARPAAPVTPPAAPTPSSPTPLEATANAGELEQRARALKDATEKTLDRIDVRLLGRDARAQYDTARRFLKQAEDALRVKNVVYAWQLADKANTIATLLK